MAYTDQKRILGLAKEAVKGTFVPPTDYMLYTGALNVRELPHMIRDESWRASMSKDFAQIMGLRHAEVDWSAPVYPDQIGHYLASILGDEQVTGAAAPYAHTFSLLNTAGDAQPATRSLVDSYGPATRGHAYCMCTDLDLKFASDGLLDLSCKWLGQIGAITAAPVPAYPGLLPIPGYQVAASFAGTPLQWVSGNCHIARKEAWIPNPPSQDQIPFVSELTVSGSLTLVLNDDTQMANLLANTQGALVLSANPAGQAGNSLTLTMSKMYYELVHVTQGTDYLQANINFVAGSNVTDIGPSGFYSPLKAVLTGARPTIY